MTALIRRLVVAVDLAAALVLLKARSQLDRREEAEALATPWTMVGLPLLALATVLYLASFPWLATTGL